MATSKNWHLFVHNGRHNHKIAIYSHVYAQSARLTEDQLQQTEQFRKSHKIYNVVAKIKRDRMQGRNTIEEVLRLSAERGYTIFYRNGKDNNVLSDIVVAYPTSIAIIRTWPICVDNGYDVQNEQGLDLSNVAFGVETTNQLRVNIQC
ncbi:hypothetical protein M9H77_04719 [Catharanthus roseus]|uniref:Uncharacterized protein n=1 Tax=Catharanthus roseus TaxID=4058 RepID=A0ACC0CF09_CATRO|nr:hypothetical protein M9H77_04719 [Catharanthus roseus]